MDALDRLQETLDDAERRLNDLSWEVGLECEPILGDVADALRAAHQDVANQYQRHLEYIARQEAALDALERTATKIARAGLKRLDDVTGCYVYCLWGHDLTTPLYVGKSINVLARLGIHLSTPAKRAQVVRVSLIRCDDVETMDATEAALIRRHQPVLNVLGVDRAAS